VLRFKVLIFFVCLFPSNNKAQMCFVLVINFFIGKVLTPFQLSVVFEFQILRVSNLKYVMFLKDVYMHCDFWFLYFFFHSLHYVYVFILHIMFFFMHFSYDVYVFMHS